MNGLRWLWNVMSPKLCNKTALDTRESEARQTGSLKVGQVGLLENELGGIDTIRTLHT